MSTWDRDSVELFRDPLPSGFSRRVVRLARGAELDLEARTPPDAILLVDEGEVELECLGGHRRRFGQGSLIPATCPPLARLRSVGPRPLVLVAVSRSSARDIDEFFGGLGSHVDC